MISKKQGAQADVLTTTLQCPPPLRIIDGKTGILSYSASQTMYFHNTQKPSEQPIIITLIIPLFKHHQDRGNARS